MARPLSLPLFPEEPPQRPQAPAAPPRAQRKQLWMAVHFPRFSLEALGIPPASGEQVAVMEGQGQKACVRDLSQGAARLGVQAGQALNAALALAPLLKTVERDASREQGALLKLAAIGQDFTPTVSLESPASLLLEVEGSAHLFGGTLGILARARENFGRAGFAAATALAPTPVAALWLARARLEIPVIGLNELRSVLGKLPVRALPWPREAQDAFGRLGITHLSGLFRLPRDGLAKRFGKEFVETLDRALGKTPDPRRTWQAAARCRLSRELPGELSQMGHLRPYIESMVAELAAELRRHDAGVDRIKIVFKHWQQAPTVVRVGSAVPHRDERRWNELIQNQLANQALTAPVLDVELLSGRYMRYTAESRDLLGISKSPGEGISQLVDLLRARLGRTGVYGVTVTQDARPEQAWRSVEPGAVTREPRLPPPRPIDLLPAPLPLESLRYRGATLTLVDGPERIEGGWWNGESWMRDYYHALSSRGERLWVFSQDRRWYLHGLFS